VLSFGQSGGSPAFLTSFESLLLPAGGNRLTPGGSPLVASLPRDILADHLRLSAVLCVIAFAMTLARSNVDEFDARMRVHSFAVWSSVVFTLNFSFC
jgi:hypothetical protein